MPCEEFTALASARFEKPVTFKSRLRMFWHQIECVYCRRFVNQITKIRSLLKREGRAPAMPAPMKTALARKLRGSR